MAFVVGSPRRPRVQLHRKYGIRIDGWEPLSKFSAHELDIHEYVPTSTTDYMHQYANYGAYVYHKDVPPTRIDKTISLCGSSTDPYTVDGFASCADRDSVTVTKGLEWTPRGYRTLIKVDGLHDDYIVLQRSNVRVQVADVKVADDGTVTFTAPIRLTGADKDPYFELLVSDDGDSVIEKGGVSHLPLSLNMVYWGWPSATVNQVQFKVDYVRVFQPSNGYVDMEPVYQ